MTVDAITGFLSWTASSTPGLYPVTVRAQNGSSPDALQTFSLQVLPPAPPAPATSAPLTAALAGALGIAGPVRAGRRSKAYTRRISTSNARAPYLPRAPPPSL